MVFYAETTDQNSPRRKLKSTRRKTSNKLLAACDKKKRLWVRVSHKPDMGWSPAMYKERTITIPDQLVENLKEWQKKATCRLVFHTRAGRPKFDFLLSLKDVAGRANLNPDNFWLHKFRATFATRHLQNSRGYLYRHGMDGPQQHAINAAVSEAITQSENPRSGKRYISGE